MPSDSVNCLTTAVDIEHLVASVNVGHGICLCNWIALPIVRFYQRDRPFSTRADAARHGWGRLELVDCCRYSKRREMGPTCHSPRLRRMTASGGLWSVGFRREMRLSRSAALREPSAELGYHPWSFNSSCSFIPPVEMHVAGILQLMLGISQCFLEVGEKQCGGLLGCLVQACWVVYL